MSVNTNPEILKQYIADIPDYPEKGVIFRDITPLLQHPDMLKDAIDMMTDPHRDTNIEIVVALEARGFLFGTAIALELGAGFVPVRKKGKLPAGTIAVTYDLEYGQDTLEIHKDAVKEGDSVIIVDDLLATGGTVEAGIKLVKQLKADIVGVAFLIELGFLKGRDRIKGYPIHSLMTF